eukprot:3162474-Karenia_brevis.AAC.1
MDSKGPEHRAAVSSAFGNLPLSICSSRCSEAGRPRYYWVDWGLYESDEVSYELMEGYTAVTLCGKWPVWSTKLEDDAKGSA